MLLQFTGIIQDHIHSIWNNTFFYLFLLSVIFFIIVMMMVIRSFRKKNLETNTIQQQHIAKIDSIRKEHSETLELIRQEMLKKEEERSRQWMESEKETLRVLNGVSTLLDLSGKIGRVESEKILAKLNEIQLKVEKITIINNDNLQEDEKI